jgi:CHASE3 domain sensor protein
MGESAQALYAEGVQGLEAAAMGEVFAAQRATLRDMCTDTDPGVNQAQKEQMDAGRAILLRSAKQLQESSRGHPEKKAMVDEVAKAMEAYFNVADEAVRLAMANRNAEAVQWLRTVAAPANNGFRQGLTRLKVFMRDRAEDQMEKNEAASRASMMALALCLAVAVALGLATSALLAAAKH